MTIKKQIAGSPTTTLSTSVTVTGSGGTYTASPTTFGLTDMSAVPSTTGTETNYIRLQKIDGGVIYFATLEYKVVDGDISLQTTSPRTSPVIETNIPANGSKTFTVSDTVFRPFCAVDVDDISNEIDAKQNELTAGNGISITSNTVAVDSSTIPTIPVSKGGTGATTASNALTNLGLSATATELNYCDGVTSSIQTQINGKQNALTAGNGISISSDTISVNASTIPAIAESKVTGLVSDLAGKQGVLTAGEGIQIDSNNVISTISYPVIYTVFIPSDATTMTCTITCNDPTIDVSDDTTQGHNPWQKRENIIKQFARHCFAKAGLQSIVYANESNFAQDINGNTADSDGETYLNPANSALYDFFLEVDTIYWTAETVTGATEGLNWKFSTSPINGWHTAHTFGGAIKKHIYCSVFNGLTDGTRLRSIASESVPTASKTCDQFYDLAHAGGTTYNIGTLPMRMLLIGLHLFLYGTKDLQSIVAGRNDSTITPINPGGWSVADCLPCNQDFSATGGWTQGVPGDFGDIENTFRTCCMTFGIMNFYGKINNYVGETVYNNGTWSFAYDAANHNSLSAETFPGWITKSLPAISGTSARLIASIQGDSLLPFVAKSTTNDTTYSNYYCDGAWFVNDSNNKCCRCGGSVYVVAGIDGAFALTVYGGVLSVHWSYGARLFAVSII